MDKIGKMTTSSIVTYKTDKKELQNIIRMLSDSIVDIIYVIDNSPTNMLQLVSDFSPKVKYHFVNKNIGYGSAHNIAIREAMQIGSRYHLCLNSDIIFNPDIIERLTEYMDSHIDVGLVMPKVFSPNGDIQYLCKLLPAPIDLLARRFFRTSAFSKRNELFELRFTGYDKEMNIPYLSGCFMLLRTDSLKNVGLFDERFFMYPEDMDLTRRIHRKYKTMFYPDVSIIHNHAAESYKSMVMLWIHIKNMIKYFNKWGWFFDKERKMINKKTLNNIRYKS